MMNFQLITNNSETISLNLPPDEVECFTQKKINEIISEVANSHFPEYLLGGIVRASDDCLSLYDGVKLAQYRWMNPDKDPLTKTTVRNVHYFTLDTLKSDPKANQFTFKELSPMELEEIDFFAVALANENPHIDPKSREQAIKVLAMHYLKIFEETGNKEWLKKAIKWREFGQSNQATPALPPRCSHNQCHEEVVAILTASKAPMTPRQILDRMVPGHGKHLNGSLQHLVHLQQVVESRTTEGRTYQIHVREPFDEAVHKINPQNEFERFALSHPTWLEGAKFGKPRKGHPEGQIIYHILEVLGNVKEMHKDDPELRLLALLHDTFKHQVDPGQSKYGENHHGKYARNFAEQIIQDKEFLDILQKHDDAYNFYCLAKNDGNWDQAEERAKELIRSFPTKHRLYLNFYECDCKTGTKNHAPFEWFLKVYQSLTST